MPSDLAFLEMDDEGLTFAYDSATESMASYSRHQIDLGIKGLSIRSVYQPLMALQGLGVPIDTNSRLFNALRTAIITNYSLLMLQGAYRTIVATKLAWETAAAEAETAAILGIPIIGWSQIWRIPIALGAAAMVAAALGGGYYVGEKLGSMNQNVNVSKTISLQGGDIRSPQERRKMDFRMATCGFARFADEDRYRNIGVSGAAANVVRRIEAGEY